MIGEDMVAGNWSHDSGREALQIPGGGHFNTGGTRKAATLDARAENGIAQLNRIGKLYARPEDRAKTIRVKTHAGTFYGIEGSDFTDRQIAELPSATINVFKHRSNRYDVDWFVLHHVLTRQRPGS